MAGKYWTTTGMIASNGKALERVFYGRSGSICALVMWAILVHFVGKQGVFHTICPL